MGFNWGSFGKVALGILTGGLSLPFDKGLGGHSQSSLEQIYKALENIPGGSIFKQWFGSGATDFERQESEYQREVEQRNYERQQQWRDEDRGREAEWRAQDIDQYNLHRQQDIDREQQWRSEDINREERWRAEDIERNSLAYKMQEAKKAGLHTATVGMGMMGSGSMGSPTMTRSGGRAAMPASRPGGGGGGTQYSPMRGGSGMNPVEAAQMISQMYMDKANQQLIIAEAERMRADERRIKEEAEALRIQNKYMAERQEKEIEHIKAMITSSDVNDQLTEKQKETLAHDLEKSIEMGVRSNQTDPRGIIMESAHEAINRVLGDDDKNEETKRGILGRLNDFLKDRSLRAYNRIFKSSR